MKSAREAKRAIADVARRKAADRLRRDGAHSMDAIRRRVRAIAQERNLQPADITKLMHKRISNQPRLAFAEKHKISLDWLLCGDLKGLQRMMQARPSRLRFRRRSARNHADLFSALTPQ